MRKTALSIAGVLLAKQPDLLVVELAALLHDVLDKKYASETEAADAYAYFLPFFQSLSSEHGLDLISDGRAHQIVKVIENVSWTTEKKLRDTGKIEEWHNTCVELHCVQDADRLDAIGAFGKLEDLWSFNACPKLCVRNHAVCCIQCCNESVCMLRRNGCNGN